MGRIVLVRGPCKGEFHDVEVDAAEFSAINAAGERHLYVRTGAVDADNGARVVIFRIAAAGGT